MQDFLNFSVQKQELIILGFIDEPERMDTQSLKNLFPTRIATAETVADFCYDLVFNPQGTEASYHFHADGSNDSLF